MSDRGFGSALGKKLRRDLFRLKGQVVTIALVLACGVLAIIMLRSTYDSLIAARDRYYSEYRFGDVFAHVHRAPEQVARRLEAVPEVARVETRIVENVMVPLAGEPDPIGGRIISLPDTGEPALNVIFLRAGRLPAAGDEAVILEQFAQVHHVVVGDRLPVVINGQLRQLSVVGIGMSPEFVLAMSGRSMFVDNRTFVVIWMQRSAVAAAFRLEGAFNDVVIALAPDGHPASVLDRVDRELAPYGGFHAVARDRQLSNQALVMELDNLRNLALVIPAVFLAIAAFLVNVVVSRLVFLERTQIAVLKALGYSDRQVATHYLLLVVWIVVIGAALGLALGAWAGRWMTNFYAEFYRFPGAIHHIKGSLIGVTVASGMVAALGGALVAALRVARMQPAQAMRPPAPLTYRRSITERLGIARFLGPSAMMVVREIERRPWRFALSTAGIALGVAMFIFGQFSWDSFDYLMEGPFKRANREEVVVVLASPQPARVVNELAALPEVERVEGERSVGARIHAGSRWRDLAVIGYPAEPTLHRPLDDERPLDREHDLTADGVAITDRLGEALGVGVGDEVDLELLEGRWPTVRVPVTALVREPFGMQIHARRELIDHWLDSEPRVTTLMITTRPDVVDATDRLRARLKDMPVVVGVSTIERVIASYREQTGESMYVIVAILGLSAAAIAIGIVYNNARIALSLRSRDLATLRVLGFARHDISAILLGELAVSVLLGIPFGLVLGKLFAKLYVQTIDPEMMEFPLHIAPGTYGGAAAIALVSGLISALLVRRKLDRLDLLAVLKSSE